MVHLACYKVSKMFCLSAVSSIKIHHGIFWHTNNQNSCSLLRCNVQMHQLFIYKKVSLFIFAPVVHRYIRCKGELGVQQVIKVAPVLHWMRWVEDGFRPLQASLTNGYHRDMEKLIQPKAPLPIICTTWYQPILWIVSQAGTGKYCTLSIQFLCTPPDHPYHNKLFSTYITEHLSLWAALRKDQKLI